MQSSMKSSLWGSVMPENNLPDISTSPGSLYVVATPIGNLNDLSKRAVDTLSMVDFIAAEDTRITLKLLNHLGIKKPLISCYRHNELDRIDRIVERILSGENCALCCDAGTPAISDPGEALAAAAVDNGIRIIPIPGPSAVIAAVSASGLVSGRFCFEGFIPMNKKTRKNRLSALRQEPRTMVFYEAPHKLRRTLVDLLEYMGDRDIVIARELTKIHEEIIHTTLREAVEMYAVQEPRGEFVLILSGAPVEEEKETTLEKGITLAKEYAAGGLSNSEAAKRAAKETSLAKSDIYKGMVR